MQTKTIQVKGGNITISVTQKFIENVEAFNRLYQSEAEKCLLRSRKADGQKADCREASARLMQEFDRIFGEGACRKVFGVGYVRFEAFSEFFDKLELLIEKWAKE